MAITGRTDSLNGLVALGATVKDLTGTPLGARSYRYADYFTALAAATVDYPCTVAVLELEPQEGFQTLAQMGNSPVDKFNVIHFLLHYQVAGTASFKTKEPDVVTMNDHYMDALAAFAANGGWAVVSHGKVNMMKPLPAVKLPFEGITYHASVFKYGVQIFK